MFNPKFILSVDFDGTIVENDYPRVGKLRPYAKETINDWYLHGIGIVINTCRSGKFEQDAIDFLKQHDIKYHYINENFPHLIDLYGSDCRKISADIYIDDKCLMGLPAHWEMIKLMVELQLKLK